MSFSPGTVVWVENAFGPGVAASPRCMTVVGTALGDHSIPACEQVWGPSVSGMNPSWFDRLSSLSAPAADDIAVVNASAPSATTNASTRRFVLIARFLHPSVGGTSRTVGKARKRLVEGRRPSG